MKTTRIEKSVYAGEHGGVRFRVVGSHFDADGRHTARIARWEYVVYLPGSPAQGVSQHKSTALDAVREIIDFAG
ncbi:MAG TPA: hypothetical protein VIY27_04360 [Myxococcota bacterium]